MLRRRRPEEPADIAFEGVMRQAVQRVGANVLSYDGDTVTVRGWLNGVIALGDLRATCDRTPREEWLRVVQEALHGLRTADRSGLDLRDLEQVGPLLRSRLSTPGAVLAEDCVVEHLAEGLVEVLVAEFEGVVRAVPRDVVAGWGVPVPPLFVRARAQVLDAGLLSRETIDLDGVELVALEGAYAATHVHYLPSYVDVPAAGLLVALPTRTLVLTAAMTGRQQSIDVAQALLVNAERLCADGPGGLSPDLWWWHPPELVHLPGTPTSLSPPIEFVEVLDALPDR